MTSKSAKDRFLATLPPEERAHNARILDRLSSSNLDDPIIAMFAILAESNKVNAASIVTALETAQIREKARDEEHTNNIRAEIGKLHPNGFWRRVLFSRIVGTLIWIGAVGMGTPIIMRHYLGSQYAEIQKMHAEQNEILKTLKTNPETLVTLLKSSQATAASISNTAEAMAVFASAMNQRGVVVRNYQGHVLLAYEKMQIKTTKGGKSYIDIPPPKNDNVSKSELDDEEVKRIEKLLDN